MIFFNKLNLLGAQRQVQEFQALEMLHEYFSFSSLEGEVCALKQKDFLE